MIQWRTKCCGGNLDLCSVGIKKWKEKTRDEKFQRKMWEIYRKKEPFSHNMLDPESDLEEEYTKLYLYFFASVDNEI